MAFTDQDSKATCSEYSGGTQLNAPPAICGKVRFSGTLFHFCPAKTQPGNPDSVVVAWHVQAKIPLAHDLVPLDYGLPPSLEVDRTRYAFLAASGAGPDPLHSVQPYHVPGWNGSVQDFVGYHQLTWPQAGSTGEYRIWFVVADVTAGVPEPFVAAVGGAKVSLDMDKLSGN